MIDLLDILQDSPDLVVCIGDGSLSSSDMAQDLAVRLSLPYRKILDRNTEIHHGLYHSSIYDITRGEIRHKLQRLAVKLSIIVLDVSPSQYQDPRDYTDTMDMVDDLSQLFPTHYVNDQTSTWMSDTIKKNDAFCIMPFVGIYEAPNRKSFCCHMPAVWQGDSIDFHGVVATEIRQQMLQGNRVSLCQKCYDLDDRGAESDRRTWNKDFSARFRIQSREDLLQNINVKVAHVTIDNQCNLLCRMCDPAYSHLIEKEYRALEILKDPVPLHSDSILQDLDLDGLEYITVTGGEPTINDKFLNWLSAIHPEKKQHLSVLISTNALVLGKKIKALVEQFPKLKFAVSLDGFDRTNLYIRWPGDWKKITANTDWLYRKKRLSHFNTTVSIYNITCLHEFYKWIDREYPDVPCSMNFVRNPEHMVAWNFPDKRTVFSSLEKIQNLDIYKKSRDLQKNIQYIRSNLESWVYDPALLSRFFKFNDVLDLSRGVCLADYVPDLDRYRTNQQDRA